MVCLRAEVAARDTLIAHLHGEVANRHEEVVWLHQEVASRDAEIVRLRAAVAARAVEIDRLASRDTEKHDAGKPNNNSTRPVALSVHGAGQERKTEPLLLETEGDESTANVEEAKV